MNTSIPCLREGKPDDRVEAAFHYALALAGGRMEQHCDIVKLEDYKGQLQVEWRSKTAHDLYAHYIDRAWRESTVEEIVSHYLVEDGTEIYLSGDNSMRYAVVNVSAA